MTRVRAPLALIAGVAMLGAHWLAYFFAAPDGHERTRLLESTGHGYWPVALSLSIAAAVIGLGSFVSQRLTPSIRSSKQRIFGHALPRFLTLQVGGFIVLEVAERLITGHSITMVDLTATTFVVGIAIQLVAALLAALLLVLLGYVIRQIVRQGATTGATSLPLTLSSLLWTPRLVPATGAHTLRGPPLRA